MRLLQIFLVSILLLSSQAFASPVYKWKDASGQVHFSSEKPFDGAKPADLPPIMRAEVPVMAKATLGCQSHGGTDCQAGADKDGSVICYDGFREATQRFRMTCNSPKLKISEVGDVQPDGSFTVTVRNSKAVPAERARVEFKPEFGKEVPLNGPSEIAAYGMAEYMFVPTDADIPQKKVELADLNLSCANCPR